MSVGNGRLHWPECDNVRDLGGLPTIDGASTRHAALVRADSLHRLTPDGVAALWRHGVSRVVDLRSAEEAAALPGPVADDSRCLLRPLIDPAAEARRNPDAEPTLASVYRASVVRNARHIVAGLAAIAEAPPGAVVVHCTAGKDRTGMMVALALRVAEVTEEAIAADYAYTASCLADRHRTELAAAPDEPARQRLRMRQSSAPETILAMLRTVETRYGDVRGYLSTHGFTHQQVARLRHRLRVLS
jgi:protein tyrosine/serine phosphatase